MYDSNRNDICINGKGNFAGGTYGSVIINGSGQCDGTLTAESIKDNGAFKCQGEIHAGVININGVLRCEGGIQADSIKVDGRLKCAGALRAASLDCNGSTQITGDVCVGKVDVDGVLQISGGTKLEAEEIRCDGAIRCDGQISADLLIANGFINARELVGERIIIHSQITGLVWVFPKLCSRAELIEATTIELRGVTAQSVNGRDIIIGPGCTIEHLDCSGTLFIDGSAQVKNITGAFTRTN